MSTPVVSANSLASQGMHADAMALLLTAGDRGDVNALMQAAVWCLNGQPFPRDLGRALTLLSRARDLGHVDAALMEIALTANGSGNATAPDWRRARELLNIAADKDPIAAAQRTLLDHMLLTEDGKPVELPEARTLHDRPRLLYFPAFFTPPECAHVASVAAELLEPAQVIHPETGRPMPHPIRTSDGGAIGPAREDLVIRALNMRIGAASHTDPAHGEPLTVLRYRPGQQYRPHLDTIAGAANQRVKTMLIYLNHGYGGGWTDFPALGVRIQPRGGDAILFETVLPGDCPDNDAVHAGAAVTRGVKWLASRWIRRGPIDPWTITAG